MGFSIALLGWFSWDDGDELRELNRVGSPQLAQTNTGDAFSILLLPSKTGTTGMLDLWIFGALPCSPVFLAMLSQIYSQWNIGHGSNNWGLQPSSTSTTIMRIYSAFLKWGIPKTIGVKTIGSVLRDDWDHSETIQMARVLYSVNYNL